MLVLGFPTLPPAGGRTRSGRVGLSCYGLRGPFDGWKISCRACSAALTVSSVLIGGGVGNFPTPAIPGGRESL